MNYAHRNTWIIRVVDSPKDNRLETETWYAGPFEGSSAVDAIADRLCAFKGADLDREAYVEPLFSPEVPR